MALFSKKEESTTTDVAATPVVTHQGGLDISHIIVSPRITEKSAVAAEKNVYTFVVNARANKHQVAQAVRAFYKVTPVGIAIVNVPTKYAKNWKTGRVQIKKKGFKKALVTLKQGDTIAIV